MTETVEYLESENRYKKRRSRRRRARKLAKRNAYWKHLRALAPHTYAIQAVRGMGECIPWHDWLWLQEKARAEKVSLPQIHALVEEDMKQWDKDNPPVVRT